MLKSGHVGELAATGTDSQDRLSVYSNDEKHGRQRAGHSRPDAFCSSRTDSEEGTDIYNDSDQDTTTSQETDSDRQATHHQALAHLRLKALTRRQPHLNRSH